MPLSESFGEILAYDVASDACESDIALSPLLETKVKFVVLDPRYASNAVLARVSAFISPSNLQVKRFHAQS